MLALMLTVFAVTKSHLLDGTEAVWNSKCQLLQYPPFQSRRLWWTYDGRPLPPLTFQMRNMFGSSHIHSQFDLAAAGEGWNQMFVSPDGHSLWIQQLCIRRFGEGFSHPTSDDSLDSFTQPLFYGIRASTTSWCHAIYSSHTLGMEPRNVGSVTAYPIHYEVQCVKQQVDKHLWLLVRLKLDRHKWVYQCVQIRTHTDDSLIQLRQSQSYTFEPKESLCSDLNTYESIIWIPSLQKYHSPTGVTCPLNGGFQITSIKELGKEKPNCDYETYGTLESDCVVGDGTEWSFDDPTCNVFEFKQVTKLSCLASWTELGLTFVVLRLLCDDDGHRVYSMVYVDVPDKLDEHAKSYGGSKPVWIGLGLRFPARVIDSMTSNNLKFPTLHDHIQTILTRDHAVTTLWNDRTSVHEIHIRRAFGLCDDERTTCDRGCDFDARNRLFCYKTCASDEKKCDIPQWDSCQFGSNYKGVWELFELPYTNNDGGQTSRTTEHRNLIQILGQQVRLSSGTTALSMRNVTLQCVHEISETIRDWYVVRTVGQRNGCRPRDLCLELYQSDVRSNYGEKNTNTLQFRLSQSQRQGTYVESLCDFRSAANPTKTVQPKTWIKQPINFDKKQKDSPKGMKCGLYQIRLTGTMIINTALLHVIEQTHTGHRSPHSTFPVVRTSSWTRWSDDLFNADFDANLSLTSKYATGRGKRTATSSFPKVPRICSLQLSDFNRSFGATGEFDNMLRVETACSNSLANRMLNTTHECISVYNLEQVPHKTSKVKMIITHTPSRDEYYCWIFEDTSKDLEKTYIVHVFNSPQCRYTQTPAGAIIVDEEQALIRMDLTPGLCLSCHRTWNDQQSVTEPFTQPPRATKTSHAIDELVYPRKTKVTRKMDISKQQPRMRSLRVSAQSRITTAVGHRSIRRGEWLTMISVLMSSVWFLSVVP